jgi:hypothetical protein
MTNLKPGSVFDYAISTNGGAKIADFHQTKISGGHLNSSPNIDSNSATQATAAKVEGGNSNTWIYWTIGAIAVVALVVGTHYYFKRQEEKKEPRNKSSSV